MSDDRKKREADLRADDALGALDPADRAELDALARDRADASYEMAAAAVARAYAEGGRTPLPDHVAKKVLAQSAAYFDARAARELAPEAPKSTTAAGAQVIVMPVAPPERRARVDYVRWGGWVAAAACLVIAAVEVLGARGAAVARAPDDARVALAAGTDASGAGASGEVAWSSSRQRGTIRVSGLAPSAPGEEYEAWVVDATPDGELAVPLGHFAAGRSEVVIDVRPPVQVVEPRRLVVTVERAGGVLASERRRVALQGAFEALGR